MAENLIAAATKTGETQKSETSNDVDQIWDVGDEIQYMPVHALSVTARVVRQKVCHGAAKHNERKEEEKKVARKEI